MRKRKILLAIIATVTIFFSSCINGMKLQALSWCTADVDEDGRKELLCITGSKEDMLTDEGERYGTTLEIYRDYDIISKKIYIHGDPAYTFDLSDRKPMYVQAGDINGNGRQEIAVCVYKETRYHHEMAKRPFFYELRGDCLEKIWLGSRLSRPFDDYLLFDIDDDTIDEIISIEKNREGKQLVAVYDWASFGFKSKAVSKEYDNGLSFDFPRHESVEQPNIYISGENCLISIYEEEILLIPH